ncbi:MAG: hypothetical protein M5U35_09685 [Roseovarius sp.]|nr:hypothetical protein [Roseovarius sp.]
MTNRRLAVPLTALLVAGCASFPQVDAAVSADALEPGYPALMPVGDLRAAAAARAPSPGATTLLADAGAGGSPAPEIDARAARLKARAARLRDEAVIDAAARERLSETVEIDEQDI